jgi:hypothetical protein
MQVSRDMADNDRVVEMADKLLSSSTLGASGKEATAFVKAMALYDLGRGDESVAIWRELGIKRNQECVLSGAVSFRPSTGEGGVERGERID